MLISAIGSEPSNKSVRGEAPRAGADGPSLPRRNTPQDCETVGLAPRVTGTPLLFLRAAPTGDSTYVSGGRDRNA